MTPFFFATARVVNAFYFVSSCVYCLLSHSSFANEQFIRPQLIGWLPDLVARHHELFWLTLVVTVPTLLPALRRGTRRARRSATLYIGLNVALGLWLTSHPVLALVGPDLTTIVIAVLCLVPPLWLAVVDHLAVDPPNLRWVDDRRLFRGVGAAAILVWLTYAVLIPWYAPSAPGVELGAFAFGLAAGVSLLSHVLLFALVYLVTGSAIAVAALGRRPLLEYWALSAVAALGLALLLERVVATVMSFDPVESWVVTASGLLLSAVWSGIAWQLASQEAAPHSMSTGANGAERDAIELWFLPITGGVRGVALSGLVALPFVAFALRATVAQFDWNFLLQKLGVCLIWALTLGWACHVTRHLGGLRRPSGRAPAVAAAALIAAGLAGVPAAARLSAWSGRVQLEPEFVLDRYSALDGSYHLIRDLLNATAGDHAAFYTFLKANSTLGLVTANPVDVAFVDTFEASSRPPHMFVFIVDSLRRDYLSPYNPTVTFTPAAQALAADAIVFERAFTRYGSTGLSVPSLWAGGMLLHKQYVRPFAPMNALEKLLDGAGYRRYLSDDHLVTELFRATPATTLLDTQIQEMDHTMCATTRELRSRLEETGGDERPIFAMTRPLQLHTARLVRDPPTSAADYPGFVPGYAAQVSAVDRCLGEFVAYLKDSGLYDESVLVLTSDHGESLGEDGRWGHGNALHPEVVQIPLIIKVPGSMAPRLTTDRSQVALSTDITPTLYALAGYPPVDRGPLYGAPLVSPTGQPIAVRRRDSFLLSASYGPGYAMLRHNGRALYLADAVQGRDFAYEMGPDGEMARQTVTDITRAVNRQLIREQIGQIASEYGFSPAP